MLTRRSPLDDFIQTTGVSEFVRTMSGGGSYSFGQFAPRCLSGLCLELLSILLPHCDEELVHAHTGIDRDLATRHDVGAACQSAAISNVSDVIPTFRPKRVLISVCDIAFGAWSAMMPVRPLMPVRTGWSQLSSLEVGC